MKTIKEVFKEFLKEQKNSLSSRTYREYENVILTFEEFLDECAEAYLFGDDMILYDEQCENGDKQYCEIFDSMYICPAELGNFFEEHLVHTLRTGNTFIETSGRVLRKFMKWTHERGYIDEEAYAENTEFFREYKENKKKAASNINEFRNALFSYVDTHPVEENPTFKSGDFEITRIETGKLWVEDYLDPYREIGPVKVPEYLSSMAKVGWYLCLEIVKTGDFWQIVLVESVSPRCPY